MRNLSILFVCVLTGCGGVATTIPGSDADVTQPDGSVNPDGGVNVDSSVPDGGSAMGCLASDTDTVSITLHKPYVLGGQINLDGEGTGACGQPDFSDGDSLVVDNGYYNTTQDTVSEITRLGYAFNGTHTTSPSSHGHSYLDITITNINTPIGDVQTDDPCIGIEIHTYTDQYDVGTFTTTGAMVAGRVSTHMDSVDIDLPFTDAVMANLAQYCLSGCPDATMHMSIADITLNLRTNTLGGDITFYDAQMGGYIVDAVSMYSDISGQLNMGTRATMRAPALYDVRVQNGQIVPCNGAAPNALSVQIMSW